MSDMDDARERAKEDAVGRQADPLPDAELVYALKKLTREIEATDAAREAWRVARIREQRRLEGIDEGFVAGDVIEAELMYSMQRRDVKKALAEVQELFTGDSDDPGPILF
jgi:hypothetical protein